MTSTGQTRQERVRLKDAGPDDLPQLLALKPDAAIHRDRLEAAAQGGLKYLIILHDEEIVGYALLVFDAPPTWPSIKLLPAVIDLWIRADRRCRGVGTRAIRIMEQMAKERGCQELHLGVDPVTNRRAYALYHRLGYRPVQDEPFREHWRFTTSDGQVHEGCDWRIDMRIALSQSAAEPVHDRSERP